MSGHSCVINGRVVELQLLSDDETTALFGPRRGIREGSTPLQGNEEESASYKERLKLPVDRYGFYIEPPDNDQFHRSLEMSPAVLRQRDAKEGERLQKWLDMRKAWASNGVQRKLNERCRKGIPHKVREWAWYNISHADRFAGLFRPTAACASNELPAALVSNTTTLDDIERDIPRTFPRHLLFMPKNGIGQLALHRLLRCYAQHDPEVGYCQGMGFIAGMLLTVMDECRALATFIAALSGPCSRRSNALSFKLRELYLPSMVGAQRMLHVFNGLGRRHLGQLWVHLEGQGMHPTMYATEWFMTMFCRGFNFELVMRVWDVFLVEDFKIVFRVALALIKNVEKELLVASFEDIMSLLRNLPERTDATAVMDLAWRIPVTRKEIFDLEKEYTVQQGGGI